MKLRKLFLFTALILLINNLPSKIFAQANSVALKDSSGNVISLHSSIQNANQAIPSTITQRYIIEILPTYTGFNESGFITFTHRNGASTLNNITVRPSADNPGVILTKSISPSFITFNGAGFINIDGRSGGTGSSINFKVRNTSTNGTVIRFLNGANNISISYCHTIGKSLGAPNFPKNIFIDSTTTGSYNISIINCKIDSGYYGILSLGRRTNHNYNLTIKSCEIMNFFATGILIDRTIDSVNIDSNYIHQDSPFNINGVTGMTIGPDSLITVVNIRQNKICCLNNNAYNSGTNGQATGISYFGRKNCEMNMENNFVSMAGITINELRLYGIRMEGWGVYNVFYNTVLIDGNDPGGILFYPNWNTVCIMANIQRADGVINMKNNLCLNNRTNGNAAHIGAIIDLDTNSISDIDYNCYYSSDSMLGVNAAGNFLGSYFNDITNYKNSSYPNEQHTNFEKSAFVSSNDLHLHSSSFSNPYLRGIPVSITTDIDGNVRSSTIPYIGADEPPVPFGRILDLKLLIEGFYDADSNEMVRDTLRITIRDVSSPYVILDSSKTYLTTGGNGLFNFNNLSNNVNYYIALTHRNSIETWNLSGGSSFNSDYLEYDFTLDSTNAFGDNMKRVDNSPVRFAIYGGDVNQDGIVDGTDAGLIDNDAFNFVTGYVVSDLNGDEVVDGSDAAIADNNAFNFVTAIIP